MRLDVRSLTKRFDGNEVLSDVSIDLSDVHALVIIGPSGGGKSTLLRLLAGLIVADEGSIRINDREVPVDEEALRQYRKSIGMVFQSFNLFPHLNAIDNISLPLEKVHGYARGEARERAYGLLERFSLSEHVEKKPAQLSGGQKQRVAIARAVAANPEFLLFDEPTSALDPEFTAEVLDMIEELREEKKDLVLVTHEMGFARQVSDHVLFLDQGRLLDEGEAAHIFDRPSHKRLSEFLDRILKY